MLEIIINKEKDKKSIMLVENGILVEKHEEDSKRKRLEGNIYCGKVQNVLGGMQSAFVDIGDEKNTFIRLKDALPKEDESKSDEKYNVLNCNIKDVMKLGDRILVQVKRDGTEKKGARVSTHINLPGRFVVYMPNSNFITVSQKIENEKERERLINIVQKILPKDTGAILRTSSEGIDEDVIKTDLENLIKEWENIKKQYNDHKLKEPKMLYDNRALLRRTLIDVVDRNLDKVIVNDIKTYADVNEILKSMSMSEKIKLELREEQDLLDIYSIREQLEKIENRKIWLRSGGFITIDRTEALTAIDVNTGKFIGSKNLENTVFKVNKEASIEIAKQLRLRDIGGIIIIDYIDMHNDENKNEILRLLTQELKKDRTKSQILGFTKLNLLEMTRKNMCNNDDF